MAFYHSNVVMMMMMMMRMMMMMMMTIATLEKYDYVSMMIATLEGQF